ncbi:MAG: hypothetical protein M3R72_04515 [Bacteroidota bacterium]|nr:hypothetical protein [Bacteroidota bacterium]
MLYFPENIISFGINKGHTLKEIFYYKPDYIANFLIRCISDFEINIEEFKRLPTATYISKLSKEASHLSILEEQNHFLSNSVEVFKNSGYDFKQVDYRFPEECHTILQQNL